MPIQARIFLGLLLNKPLKMHLNRSPSWKEAKISQSQENAVIIEINWKGEEYIGMFIPVLLNCTQIKECEKKVKNQLKSYCPKMDFERETAYLLSQLFIS